MKLSSKNICIITHQFPPYGKVAGRRWMLFTQQLLEQGANVKVVSTKGELKESPWSAEGIDVVYVKDNYPKAVKKPSNSLYGKIMFRFWIAFIKFKYKGYLFDKGLFWISNLKKFISNSQFERDTIFILTGAPFSLFTLGEFIKSKGFKYILDYRDPYTWNNAYGFDEMPESRRNYEIANEKIAAKGASKITFPNEEMVKEYSGMYPEFKTKCEVLAHPLDKQSITRKWQIQVLNNEKIRLVYAGTLYDGCINEFKDLIIWIKENSNLCLTIYTHLDMIPNDLQRLLKSVDRISIRQSIPATEVYTILNNYDAYLIIQSDEKKNYVTTKFVDLVYFEIPTVVHCSQGVLTDILTPLPHMEVVNSFNSFNIAKWLQNIVFDKTKIASFLEKYAGKIET